MDVTRKHLAVAAVLAALSLPALAADDSPAAKQDCSVCSDPTFPEIRTPAPAFVFRAQPGGESDPTPFDPTQPEVKEPAPALALRARAADGPAAVQGDPTWPEWAAAAPALHLEGDRSEERVARAKK